MIKDVHFLLKQIECNREKKFHRSANWKNKKILKSLVLQKLQLVPSQNISYIHFRWLYYIVQINSSDIFITFLVSYHHAFLYLFSYFIKQYPTTLIYIFSLLCSTLFVLHTSKSTIYQILFSVFLGDSLHYVYINTSICIS